MEKFSNCKGASLLEAIVALTLVSIVFLSHVQALILNSATYNRTRRNSLAMQQAIDIMEYYSAKDPVTLSDANDFAENNFLYNGIRFDRSLNVTTPANASVVLDVAVRPTNSGYGGSATLSRTIAFPDSR